MDVAEVSIMDIVYLSSEIGQIKYSEGNWYKGSPINMLTNLVSQ